LGEVGGRQIMPAPKNYHMRFTKEQLQNEYKNISVCDIAKKYNIPQTGMYRIFDRLNIKRRKCNSPGKLASFFKHLRCSRYIRKHCNICGKELSSNPNAIHCIKCHNYLNSINKERLKKCSESIKEGWKNRNFAKILGIKKKKYKSIWMRSSWEVAYAKWCDKNHIKWLYEPKTFDLGNCSYTPDFYLPKSDIYVEIKGYWRDRSKLKFELFKKTYDNILLLKEKNLIELGVLK
jgi:predicted nuclease of restriction endonuclease-like RecB superfamily